MGLKDQGIRELSWVENEKLFLLLSHSLWHFSLFAWQINQMFAAFPPDVSGNLDYKNLCYVITHGEEKDWEQREELFLWCSNKLFHDALVYKAKG